MADKTYTVQEANALLPYLAPTLTELRDKFEDAAEIRVAIVRSSPTNGGSKHRERWSKVLARVAELLDRLREWEIVLRDISTGLVDFPSVIDGREAFLCWKLGEDEIAFWHSPDDGFQGRRPL
jgi:hypothetical protein